MRIRVWPGAVTLVIVLAVIGVFQWYANMEPSIKPEDISIEAILRPPGRGERLLMDDRWTIEITLEKTTDLPLYVGAGGGEWFSQVAPNVNGFVNGHYDFLQGLNNGGPAGDENFVIGLDGRHIPLVAEALQQEGLGYANLQQSEYAAGFGYTGADFPARARFYLYGEGTPNAEESLVVYSHYEKRWGKDLSWAKAYPVVMP